MTATRIFLSPPDVGPVERELLLDAFDSNWIAPLGPHVDAFEAEMEQRLGRPSAALSSGTAALHLALLMSGVQPGDEVIVPSLTFAATANAVRYVGARPLLVDAQEADWNIDPDLVAEAIADARSGGRRVSAMIPVDLYGQCADYDRLLEIAGPLGVAVIADAAESLGATYKGSPAGTQTDLAALSFNGNKIITTSGGGMLVGARAELADRARHLATQARVAAAHYEHEEVGYNYRLSNLLAAVGRGQLSRLDDKLAARKTINRRYRELLADIDGIAFLPVADHGEPNNWLTVITVDAERAGADREAVRLALVAAGIEARPGWKPMHQQPAMADCTVVGGTVADRIFRDALCLPSGDALTEDEQAEIVDIVRSVLH